MKASFGETSLFAKKGGGRKFVATLAKKVHLKDEGPEKQDFKQREWNSQKHATHM